MTRIYIVRRDQNGFKNLTKVKQINLADEWLNFEIKTIGKQIFVSLNSNTIILGLNEDDNQLAFRSGTLMLGINNDTVEFSDISIGIVPVPLDSTGGGSASSNSLGSDEATGMDDDEAIEEEDAIEHMEDFNSFDGSAHCRSKQTCSARSAWCSDTFKNGPPSDCVEMFSDMCCTQHAHSNLINCKEAVDIAFERVDIQMNDVLLTGNPDCFEQSLVTGDKLKFDSCSSCCAEKLDLCYSESSRLNCNLKCQTIFEYETDLATNSDQADTNTDNSR